MSSGDLLTKFDELTKRFRQECEEMIEKERAKMKAEVEAYNIEKEKMRGIRVEPQDIIHLNVGGQKMSTTRETLCQVEDSMLASMFSGRWEESLTREKGGRIFFDQNPNNFALILDYLRATKTATAENPASQPEVPGNQVKNYNDLVEYLGLSDELATKPEATTEECFGQHYDKLTIIDGTTAVHPSNDYCHEYVLGSNVYSEGVIQGKLKVESFNGNHLMFFGIVESETKPLPGRLSGWPGSYGWALGVAAGILVNGKYTPSNSLKNLTKQGDTVTLTLDCSSSKLSVLTEDQSFIKPFPVLKYGDFI